MNFSEKIMDNNQKFYTESRFISKPAMIIGVVALIITAAGFFVDRGDQCSERIDVP